MNTINVMIIDDNEDLRELLKELLEFEADIKICGEAGNVEQAREAIAKFRPDIAIVDLSLNGSAGGLDFLKEMPVLSPLTKAIVLSAHDERAYAPQSLQAGARGYVCKDKTVQCMVQAIRQVQAGEEFVSSS